jgi:transposase-like protein
MKRKINRYPDELKLKVVQEYLQTGIGLEVLQKKYGISSNTSIYTWMRKFGLSTSGIEPSIINTSMKGVTEKTAKEKELESKIKQLEKDLDYEKLRTHALDTMINIAERDLKITIRKKHGAKQ